MRRLRRRHGRASMAGITTRHAGHGETTVYSYGERLGEVRGGAWKASHGGKWQLAASHGAAVKALVRATTGRTG